MGRHRTFDPDDALDAIKAVFWTKGYEGTSLQDIEKATGLNKQSLYRLYTDKRGMYIHALANYEKHELAQTLQPLWDDGHPAERFSRLFDRIIDIAIVGSDRRGCFLCSASVDQAQIDSETSRQVENMVRRLIERFSSALKKDEAYERDRSRTERASALMLSTYFGMHVMIKANQCEAVLQRAQEAVTSLI